MKILLLCGGSGRRLWPMSNGVRSKQFLRLLPGEDGPQSMAQRTWREIRRAGLDQSTAIVTTQAQSDSILHQLGNEPQLIIEPAGNDTFAAVALGVLQISEQFPEDDDILVMPIDSWAGEGYLEFLCRMPKPDADSGVDLVLAGVRPTFPATQYGYILPTGEPSATKVVPVAGFTEKPDENAAAGLVASGALWNCGVFRFRAGWLKDQLSSRNLPVNSSELLDQYESLPRTSFDYEVVESARSMAVVAWSGEWKDLGTWSTMAEHLKSDFTGEGFAGPNGDGCIVINELEIPVVTSGVSNTLVVASPDGILVADRNTGSELRHLVADLDQPPMVEERRWGSYRILSRRQDPDGLQHVVKHITLLAGRNLSYQYHLHRREVWNILAGTGELVIDGRFRDVGPGDVLIIEAESHHALRATTELQFIEIQSGTEVSETDIVRLEYDWERIVSAAKRED